MAAGTWLIAGLSLLAAFGALWGHGGQASADDPAPPVVFVPELGLPATEVVAFGATSAESPGGAWAYGYLGPVPPAGDPAQVDRYALLDHSDANGWRVVPLPGQPLRGEDIFLNRLGALAGRTTPAGGVALITGGGIFLRDPGGEPQLVPAPAAELIGGGESLPPQIPAGSAPTPFAALDEEDGRAGLLIAPYRSGAASSLEPGVLRYDGRLWTREVIEAEELEGVAPLAIGCGPAANDPARYSPRNCWLLARATEEGTARLVLFHREPREGGFTWSPQPVQGGLLGGQIEGGGTEPRAELVPLTGNAQMLTVTGQGIWVDFQAALGESLSSATELVVPGPDDAEVLGSWCYPSGPNCERSLGAPLPSAYRSFAWPGAAGDPGTRLITGLPKRAMLRLAAGAFAYARGAGGSPGAAAGGAAFATPEAGLIADGADPHAGRDGGGQSQVYGIRAEPEGSELGAEPVPFRHPLLAIAVEPGGVPGGPDSEAIAVGLEGQAARFVPGLGWRQHAIVKEPGVGPVHLRDVAWPTADTAYAVSERQMMWEWNRSTDSWRRDTGGVAGGPAYLNGVAFSHVDPSRGFAVGQEQLVVHAPEGWQYSQIPPELLTDGPADFTSVAFAGDEGIASFRSAGPLEGGVIRESGSGWEIDRGLQALFQTLPAQVESAPTQVAGLPDGGALAAGPGWVAKRESASSPWTLSPQPLPEAQTVAALAGYRDAAGNLRAIVSIAPGPYRPQLPILAGGHPPNPPPAAGYLLREIASGWADMQHQAYAVEDGSADMPLRPEPVFDLAVSADGSSGLAVGGQSGNFTGATQPAPAIAGPPTKPRYQTAAAQRFPADLVFDPNESQAIPIGPEGPAFAVGGHAACATPCADRAGSGIGPDIQLGAALRSAGGIATQYPDGLRGFLYTGGRLTGEAPDRYEAELARLGQLFSESGSLPLLTAASPDLMRGGANLFADVFAAFGPSEGSSYYTYRSEAIGGVPVLVIVLDYSAGVLDPTQRSWLREQLASARAEGFPAVVLGNASISPPLTDPPPNPGADVLLAKDAAAVSEILLAGDASAYVYDYPGANVVDQLGTDAEAILAIGTGTLGYSPPVGAATDSLSGGAYVLLELLTGMGPEGNVYPLSFRAVPAIESLTLHSLGGGVLEAGWSEQFEALGRRPPGGVRVEEVEGEPVFAGPEPYETLPFPSASLRCEGPNCRREIPLEFAFTSSNPEVGDFIDPSWEEAGLPAGDLPSFPRSGLFCARQPGETTVTVTAGGLSYSQPVTVTPGDGGFHCFEQRPEPPLPSVPSVSEQPAPAAAPQPPTPAAPSPAQPPAAQPQPAPAISQPQPPLPAPAAPNPMVPTPPASPVLAPHPPPVAQPAPPPGLSPAAQPVAQPVGQGATQPAAQSSFQPAAHAVNSPAVASHEAAEEEAAVQRAHHAVAVPLALSSQRGGAIGAPMVPAIVLLLGLGLGLGALELRSRRPAYAKIGKGVS